MERTDVLVAGGGVIGSAIACALVERGVRDVCVADVDLAGVWSSSERNAGGARATWWQRPNIETCRDGLAFFEANAAELSFRPLGYTWLYDDPVLYARALAHRRAQAELAVVVETLTPAELAARVPLVDRGLERLVGATFSPRDGLLNANALKRLFRARALAGGARFLDRHWLEGVELVELAPGERRIVRADFQVLEKGDATDESGLIERALTRGRPASESVVSTHTFRPELFVNALGAWSPHVSAALGAFDPTRAVRRQLSLVDVRARDFPPGVVPQMLGMLVLPSGLYLHAEGTHILAGYSIHDEPAGYDFRYDGEAFFESELWPRLAERASAFERCKHVRGWAGLYAVTPDASGILGRVDGIANALEAHSFTGRGVMQSFAIGRAVAELVCDGGYRALDLTRLSARRFREPRARWLVEDLHI